ncbi:gamma-butyrobetaine hydroxylase-like domain-containing protein [Entomomonas asaccharolytica]|uniref:DUF971 domain-containing protein n=1 Tax=Entomomonas asaccharolytica TaxID=2785331 RepID=A0A974RXG2_9GAMM|nr:DUF971 domain-containing protein [Entomomonas asaccharolytica]QQP86193.1 DUF971 domain-containing protein [Entomomonas asaccharolytica]
MQIPETIKLKKTSNLLELAYQGQLYQLSAEYLRVNSPSAEVQGHGNPILQYGKKEVKLIKIEPAGQYALKLTFDDGHDTGLYTWEYLYKLATEQKNIWDDYLKQLNEQGKSRDPNESIVKLVSPSQKNNQIN